MKTMTEAEETEVKEQAPSGRLLPLVGLVWQTVDASKGNLFLDVHREDADPVITRAIEQAILWGMNDMEAIRKAIGAAFDAHQERLCEAMSDAVNMEANKAMQRAGCSW